MLVSYRSGARERQSQCLVGVLSDQRQLSGVDDLHGQVTLADRCKGTGAVRTPLKIPSALKIPLIRKEKKKGPVYIFI